MISKALKIYQMRSSWQEIRLTLTSLTAIEANEYEEVVSINFWELKFATNDLLIAKLFQQYWQRK